MNMGLRVIRFFFLIFPLIFSLNIQKTWSQDSFGRENCSDGVDDDKNGLTDCEDPVCFSDISCQSASIPEFEGPPPLSEDCFNRQDDNGNGLIDCKDIECEFHPLCLASTNPPGDAPRPPSDFSPPEGGPIPPDQPNYSGSFPDEARETDDRPTVYLYFSNSASTSALTTQCVPTTCAKQKRNCGEISDGCDGVLFCGRCPAGEICGGGKEPNVCGRER